MKNKKLSFVLKSLKSYESFLQKDYATVLRGIDNLSFLAEKKLHCVLREIGVLLKIPKDFLVVPFFGDMQFFNEFYQHKKHFSQRNELIFEVKTVTGSPIVFLGIPEERISEISAFWVGGGMVLDVSVDGYVSKKDLYKFFAGTVPLAQLILCLSAMRSGFVET